MRPTFLLVLLFASIPLFAAENSYSTRVVAGDTPQPISAHQDPNLFVANKFSYQVDGDDVFGLSSSVVSGAQYSLVQKPCDLLTVASQASSGLTFSCQIQGLPFQLDTSVTKLPSHFGTQGYSSLLLGIDDSTASLYVLSQNTPPELVKKIAGFFFDESASADLPPQSCQVLLNSDLKYLLMTCELQKVVPAPASPLPAPLPLAKDDPESTIVAQPGPLAWEDPLKGTVATEAVQTLSFASKNPFGESLFYVLPFAPGENFEGASIKEMCQKDLVNAERYDFAPHRRFMKWLDKTVRDSKDAVSKIGGKSVFFGKTQLCVVYSNGNQYEDLVFQLARVDPDGSEAIIRQKKCTYSTDRTPGRKNPCATQNDPTPGFHSVIWDTTQPVYNPLKTSEYLDAGKTYRLRMIGSVLHEGKKTITHFENYAYIQSEQGMYRERVVFGNLVIKTTNLALPVRLTWDGAFVGILQPGQTQAEFILPVGKHRLKICDTDRDIVLLPVIPFIENVDCKGASFASEETFSKAVDRFITEAKKFIGQAYVWGGTSITGYSGVDCSGLIVSAYQKTMATGFKHKDLKGSFCTSGKLARTADEQFTCLYQNAQSLSSPSDLLPGDLIFEEVSSQCFQLSPKKEVGQRLGECYVGKGGLGIGHVLIYLGNKKLDPQGKLISADTLEASGDNVHSGKDRGFEKILDFARIPWSSTESPDQKETLEKDGKSGEGGGGDGKTVWISMEHDSCVRGTSTSGHQEIVENFNIALKLRKYLQARGLTVLISKDYRQLRGKVEKIGDVGTNSLISFNGCGGTEERNRNAVCRFFNQDNACKAANSDELDFEAQAKAAKKLGASVIVAPHFDAAYGSRAVYYKVSAGESSRKLAESLADRMGEASIKSDQPIRGGKGSGLLAYAAKEGIPSVLVEFDPLNDAKFSDKNYADLLARHAAEGIANFLGSGKNAPTSLKSCSAADFSSPINQPQPRKKDADGAAFWYGSSDRKVSVDNQDGHHEGVDIAGIEHQTPVLAAGNGVIQDYSAAPPCGDGVPGTAVIIRHDCTLDGQPVFTKYCHLSRENIVSLKAGTRVAKGKLIGYVGKTGNANSERISTHLHVEYLKGGSFNEQKLLRNGAKDFDPVAAGFLPKTLGRPSAG